MEPFTLHCTTCRARLKVKDESALGSILNCPRCGSMVHVVPPVDWQSPDGAGAAGSSQSGTESSITLSLPLSSAIAATSAALPPTPPTLPKAVATSTEVPIATPTDATTEVAMTADAVDVHSNIHWTSSAAAWLRGDGLVWAGGLAAGVVVGAMTWFVITSLTSSPPATAETSKPIQIAQADVKPATESPAPAPAAESAPGSQAPAPVPVGGSAPQVAAAEKEQEPSAPLSEVDAPPVPKAPPNEQPVETALPTSDAPSATSEPIAEREPSLKLDPAAAPAASAADDAVVDAILGPVSAAEPSAADAADANVDVDQPTGPVEDDSAAMSQEDVDTALAVRLSEVKFVAAPLAQFVEFIADTSALAISIDDAALAKAGKKRTMPLSVHMSDTTAQEALQAAISPLGLVCELRGNRLFVTVPADAGK